MTPQTTFDKTFLTRKKMHNHNTCNCEENCSCHSENQNKEIAFELCRTLIEGRTYTAEGVAEAFKKIYEAVKNCE